MADSTISPPPRAEERRFAFLVLLGIVAVMLLITLAVGTRIYHQVRDRQLQEEAAAATATESPAGQPKKEEPAKASLTFGQFLKGARDPLFLWAFVNTLLLGMGCVVYGSLYAAGEGPEAEPRRTRPVPPLKLILVGVGGLLGFTTTCFLGIGFALYWWKDLSEGGLKVWKETWTWLLVLAAFGGLILTFASLLAVRSEERHNPLLRRLLYGFNAFLVGFLLLSILVVVNGLFMIYGTTQTIDWTKSQFGSLSAPTKKVLGRLDKPLEAYLLMVRSGDSALEMEMNRLLDNCKHYTGKLEVHSLYATSRRDTEKLNELLKRYEMTFQEGLLLVYDPNGENQHLFIKRTADGPDDLGLEDAGQPMMRGGKPKENFRGEQALLHALNQFLSGKTKVTIYVTQDSGEFSLTDTPATRAGPQGQRRSLSALKTKLEKAGYRVEPWQLGLLDEKTRQPKELPDDANIVLIAGANDSIQGKLKPLYEFMKRPDSRLLIFTEPTRDRDGRVQPTGWEAFLKPFGLEVRQDLIVHLPVNDIPLTDVVVRPSLSGLPGQLSMDPRLESAFLATGAANQAVPIGQARSLLLGPTDRFEALPMLQTVKVMDLPGPFTAQWPESSPFTDVDAYMKGLIQNQNELEAKLRTSQPLFVAVTVADKGTPEPPTQPGMPPRSKPGKPRLVVFGSTGPLSSAANERATLGYFFITSSLGWLSNREVALDSAVPVKQRDFYDVRIPIEDTRALVWLPLLFLLLLVILAGVGVNLLRRR